MIFRLFHADLDELAAFRDGALPPKRRRRLAAHLRRCVRCQQALRFITRLGETATELPAPAATADLLARALATRAAGERRILPAFPTPAASRTAGRRRAAGMAAAAAVLVAVVALSGRTPELEAVGPDSELRIAPAHPRIRDTISIVYEPSPGLFGGSDSLVLRARLRTPSDEMYAGSVPSHRVRAVAMLRRARDGAFTGRFVLPDSVVFASLAVEDQAATRVDDNAGRLWEVVTHGPDDRPTFDALDQRVNDMMGRSWEEAYGTARRLTEMYPGRISSWTLREFFESTLFGEAAADSLGAAYAATIDSLIAVAKSAPALPEGDIGTIFYRQRNRAMFRNGTAADSAEARYWWERIQREYPRHPQVAQHHALMFTREDFERPTFILDSIERVYPRLVPITGPGQNLLQAALQAAVRAGDDAAYRRWRERSLAGVADSASRLAFVLAAREPYRREGMNALRELYAAPARALVPVRGLAETAAEYERRVQDARRRVLVALGRALVADGRTRAGLDTLRMAAHGAWNVQIFRDLVGAYLAAGDTSRAEAIRIRLAVDPRTHADTAAAIEAAGRARLGAAGWDSVVGAARREMHERLLERSKLRALRGAPRLADESSRMHALRDLTGGRPAVIIFWSRNCGAALEALPAITKVAERLHAAGTPVILVIDEPPAPELAALLAERKWILPAYYDTRAEMATAFANFGTPTYYVLDAAGRIRFDRVDGEAELIAQVEALNADSR